jgi:ABC-type sugar transport system substrate-binding protein
VAAQGVRIAIVGAYENDPRWPGIRGGAARFLTSVPSLVGDFAAAPEQTSDSLKDVVAKILERRPSAVCLDVADAETARAAAELVLDSQIVLVTLGMPLDDARVTRHVSVDWPGGAELLGGNLTRVAAGRKSYLLVHDRGRNPTATRNYQRFTAAAQNQYGVTLLQEEEAVVPDVAAQRSEELLRRFSHAGLLVTLNANIWVTARAGWQRDLRALNSEFRFVALSTAPTLWARLGTPEAPGDAAALAGPLDGEIGYAAVQAAVQKLFSPSTPFADPVIRCELVLPENLTDFAQRYSAAANGLDVRRFLGEGASSQPQPGPSGPTR